MTKPTKMKPGKVESKTHRKPRALSSTNRLNLHRWPLSAVTHVWAPTSARSKCVQPRSRRGKSVAGKGRRQVSSCPLLARTSHEDCVARRTTTHRETPSALDAAVQVSDTEEPDALRDTLRAAGLPYYSLRTRAATDRAPTTSFWRPGPPPSARRGRRHPAQCDLRAASTSNAGELHRRRAAPASSEDPELLLDVERLVCRRLVRNNVEAHGLRQRPALPDSDDIALLRVDKARRDVRGKVLVALLETAARERARSSLYARRGGRTQAPAPPGATRNGARRATFGRVHTNPRLTGGTFRPSGGSRG